MNVIYLNERLKYEEAFSDPYGQIIIPEKNLIVGFVDEGMLWAIKDPGNLILTPFEIFVQFNDMSLNMVEKHRFQPANRIINFEGLQFCELKEVFNCIIFASILAGVRTFFNDTILTRAKLFSYSLLECLFDVDMNQVMWGQFRLVRTERGFVDDEVFYDPIALTTHFISEVDVLDAKKYELHRSWVGVEQPGDSFSQHYINPAGSNLTMWNPKYISEPNGYAAVVNSKDPILQFVTFDPDTALFTDNIEISKLIKASYEPVDVVGLFPVGSIETPLTAMRLDFYGDCEYYQVLIEGVVFFTSVDPLAVSIVTANTQHRQGLDFTVNYRFVGGVNKTRTLQDFEGYDYFQCP